MAALRQWRLVGAAFAVALVSVLVLQASAGAAGVTLVVNSTADAGDTNLGDGVCRTGAGACTLRAAVQEANALAGHNTISVPAGTFALAIPTLNDDLPGTGDWDVYDTVTIAGAGAGSTILDGGVPLPGADPQARGIDRLLEIHPTAGNVTLQSLTLREGFSPDDGAAIQNWSPGLLRLENVHVRDNLATGVGGGINNAEPSEYEWLVEPLIYPKSGRVEIVASTLSGNAAGGGGSAVNNAGTGTVSILDGSSVVDNPGPMIPDPLDPEGMIPAPGVYEPGASAVANQAEFDTVGTLRVSDSTVARNYATESGGGISNDGSGTLTIERSTITDNTSEATGGGVYTAGGIVSVSASTFSGNVAHDGGGLYSGGANDKVGLRSRVTVTGSSFTGNVTEAGGGGLYNGGETQLTLADVSFSANSAGDEGGGLSSNDRASMALARVTFADNEAIGEGGGAWTGSERLVTIDDSVFRGNAAGVPEIDEETGLPVVAGNTAGGGGLYSESGPMTVTGSTFEDNSATEEGGGLSIDNFGNVTFRDSVVRSNEAGADGGGLENSGFRVTFERLLIIDNRAGLDGGGIYNSSSGEFTILDTTVQRNSGLNGGGLANAPDNDLIVRKSLFIGNVARNPGISADGDPEAGGLGGGIFSLADGDSMVENTTISGNVAARGGGGIFHDADGQLKLTNLTIWRNSAPRGGGIGVVESDFSPEVPPKANVAVISKNTIVGGSLNGGSCDWFITSEGGNVDTGGTQEVAPAGEGPALPSQTWCFLSAPPNSDSTASPTRDRRAPGLAPDAIADNGGPTLTHALRWGSLAIDNGVTPCPETDQRGIARPQNAHCDSGAYEFVGPPPPEDNVAPDTQYLTGPIQDTLETVAFTFTGSDNLTPPGELQFECRLLEADVTEPPEPLPPWEPVPPELQWLSCSSPWQTPLLEEGGFTFEVRAIDRAGNVDPTPATHIIGGADTTPPETVIAEKPPLVSPSRTATFTFTGTDNVTPPQFLEYECRLDSSDPDLWLECVNPTIYSNLTSGLHRIEVRAIDGAENIDPTPARYTWEVGQLPNCDAANITLTAAADGWVDEVNQLENYLFETELTVRSGSTGDPTAVPPEPVVGQNARALFRFALPDDALHCELESATLRLYNESPTEGRTLEAVPLAATWKESTLTWANQPGTAGAAVGADSGEGYQEWNVTSHVLGMLESGVTHGWQIRDADENDPDGGDQSFVSREMPQDPPPSTLPLLVLRYAADGGPPPAPPTPPTTPTTVHCGQVLTASTLVANDLVGCLGEGLVVGAPGIVVDLGGHVITSGSLVDPGEEEGLLAGIRNSGHTNVVIRNGTVRGFGYGVLLTGGTTRTVVEEMTLDANLLAGIELNDADDGQNGNTIRDNLLTSNGEAAISLINGAENSVITGNRLDGNGGVAFQLIEAKGHRIEGNTVTGIPINPLVDSDAGADLEGSTDNVLLDNAFSDFGDAGVVIRGGSHRNRVEGNTLVRSGDAGVSIQDSHSTQVIDNLAHQSSDGGVVLNEADGTIVRGNDVRFNPNGVDVSNSNNVVIEDNDGSNTLQTGFAIGNGLNLRIAGNTANSTGGAGISMEGGAFDAAGNPVGGALIEGNTANENAETGISVADGGHTIADNEANGNAGYGIEAGDQPTPGEPPSGTNIDGGGNKATDNAEVLQCIGVVCDTGSFDPTLPDTTPPDTVITGSPPGLPGSTSDPSPTFTFVGDDGPGGTPDTAMVFECRLDPPPDPPPPPEEPPEEPPPPGEPPDPPDPVDPGNWGECLSPTHYLDLEPGQHHFEVRALDQADNVDATPATFDWQIDPAAPGDDGGTDVIAPETTITVAPANPSTSGTASFSYTGSDDKTPGLNLRFQCRLDGVLDADFVDCTSQPKIYSGLGLGSHTFEVRAVDLSANANVDPTPASYTWTIELAPPPDPPETSLVSVPDPVTVSTSATFAFVSDEPAATFECSLNVTGLTGWSACTSPKQYTGLPVGTREFQVRAVLPGDNVDPTPATYSWVVGSAPVQGTVFCGQVITKSTIVKNDIAECLLDGLVVGASNITIDLDGHTIDGKGIGAGIRNDGFDNVTIKNGTVADFDYGVMLNVGTEKNIVEHLTLERNQEAGVALGNRPPPGPNEPTPEPPPSTFQSGVIGNTIRLNEISANDLGIWLTNSTKETLVLDNELQANGKQGIWIERSQANRVELNTIAMSSDVGISLQGSSGNTLLSNDLQENGAGILLGITETGTVGLPSPGNRVEKNTIVESGGIGIEVVWSDGNQLLDNVARFTNGEGVSLYHARDTFVYDNDLRSNKSGIVLMNSNDNVLEANDTSESEGTGIAVADLSFGNTILKNVSNDNDGDGLYVGDETPGGSGSHIEGNTTNNNKGYGIYVPKVSHTIKANTANDNGGWGIWASAGSNGKVNIDGGGNKAQGNLGPLDPFTLKPLQCFTIACDGSSTPSSDPIPPDTLLVETPSDPNATGVAFFRFTGTDNASTVTFQCSLDGAAWGPCTSPVSYPALPQGAHTFHVRAVDLSGNVDLTPAAFNWFEETSVGGAPTVSIDAAPDATTASTQATFEFSANKHGSTFACSLDGTTFVACTSPKSYPGPLAVGNHQFQVRATDPHGASATATHSWKITGAPVAASVACGEILVQSTRLTNDLLDCAGHGLVVGAHGITIDLDGHVVDGLGTDAGILNNGFDSVTITNGTVSQFDYGVLLNPNTGLNVVSSLRLEGNAEAGIGLADADQGGAGNTIRGNTLVANGFGIAVYTGTRNALVTGNAIGGTTGDAILVEHSVGARIEENEITGSTGAGVILVGGGEHVVTGNELSANAGLGVIVGEELLGSNANRVERNTIEDGGGGIGVFDSTGNQILYNTARGSLGPGLVLDLARGTVVRGNDLRFNADGIELSESSDNRLESNNTSGSMGTGIAIGALSFDNVVLLNAASQNGGDGIEIEDTAPAGQGNLLDTNTADGNGGDGIGVHGVGHSLKGNSAQLNGGWGIYVAAGATDLGGNFAAGNVEPAQCFGIVCTLGTVPGTPETWILDTPADPSSSRNASFTYMGSDDISPITELVFECRLDTTNDLAWEDCEYPAEYLNLSPGEHTFQVRAIDQLGAGLADPTPATYTWTYVPLPSGVAPQAIIDLKPEPETWALDAIFTFHSNEPDVTFECKVDAFGYEPCGFEGVVNQGKGAFEWGLEETEVGLHTFSVRAIDFEGNVGEPATYTWRLLGIRTTFLDGPGFTPGETPFDPPTGGPVSSTTATLDFIANVADATYECSLDLEPFTACSPPVTYTGLIEGEHELRVVATGPDGISEPEAAVYEWEIVEAVDTTPPDTSIERAPATNSSSTLFEFVGVDDVTPAPLLTFECRVDSTSELDWFACTSPFSLLDVYTYEDVQMAPGQHTFQVRAIDAAEPVDPSAPQDGNPDPTPATHTWTMVADTTPPGTGILSGPTGLTGDPAPEFTFAGSDNATPELLVTYECSVDGGAFAACDSPHVVSGLEPGEHTLAVRAVDLAGNVDQTPATRTWTLVPPPVTTFVSGPTQQPFAHTSESATFVFTADQAGSTFECALDGGEFLPCTSPHAQWVVTNGTHELEVRATNPQGVVEEPPAVYEWLVELGPDVTPPNTTITSRPPDPDPNTVATFGFTGSDTRTPANELTFECSLDGAGFNSCTSPQQFSDLTRGSHTMRIRALDAAGNFDPTPATYTWMVDPPPVATIVSGPEEQTESTTATFTFSSDVPGSTFECWLDGLQEPCTSPKTYTNLAGGEHLFAVLPTTAAGVTALDWTDWEWEIGDLSPPLVLVESGPDVETESTSATFVFSSNEPDATVTCSLDGAAAMPCTSPHAYESLHPGPHVLELLAVEPPMLDALGNPLPPLYEPVSTLYEWTIVDLQPPDTTIDFGPPATTASTMAYFGLSSDDPTAIVECSLDGAGFSECESPAAFEDLPLGAHTLRARSVDLTGNLDPTPASYSWTIVAPPANTPVGTNVTVQLPLPGGGGNARITFFEVFASGGTALDPLNLGGALPLPFGYSQQGALYYDVSTTADVGEPITLCIPYDPADFPDTAVRLLHFDGSVWIDVTTTNDPAAGIVCGAPESLSPFAVASGSGAAPLASIISGPPNPSTSGTATFTFHADQPDIMLLCSLDGLPFEGCESPKTYTHLESGDHEFQVQAISGSGAVQAIPSLYEWEVILPTDTTAPDTTITAGPPGLTANFVSTFEFTGLDDQTEALELEFECTLDGESLGSCSSPEEIEVLVAGEHTLEVAAIDDAGNVDPTPASRTWTVVDLSAPDTSIDAGPDSETEATTATFEFSGVEEISGEPVFEFECALDTADFTACTSPHEITGLVPGPHVFHVRAVDLAGIVDPTPDFYEWLVLPPPDTTPPDTFIASGPPPANSGPDVIFGFTSNEPVEEFECSLDGGPFESCEAVHELLGLASGEHTLLVRAIDLAEIPNVDPTPASYTWTTTAEPDTTILTGPADPSDSASATFTFESDQAGATFQCSVDGSPFVGCSSPFIAGPLVEDAHEFEVRAVNQFTTIDGEQVVDQTPATYGWTIEDITPPETTITSLTFLGPTDLVEPNSFRFEFTGEDNKTAAFELEFECSLDGGPFEGCSMPHYIPLEDLTGGDHELQVRAVDELGNVDPTPASRTFATEGEPETTILTGPALEVDSSEATFTFSSDQAGASFECSLDLAPFAACTSPATFTGIAYGEHLLQVRAKSPLGMETDLTPAEHEWTSGDLTAPVPTIESGPAVATTSTEATFTFVADEAGSLFRCSLDGATPAFCSSPVTYTGLLAGEHTFTVEATNAHLLAEPVVDTWTWRVDDATAPETEILTGPPAEIALGTPASFTFGSNEADAFFECALDGGAFAECASPPENAAELSLPAGPHTLLVRAVDPSGNVDPTPVSRAWTVVGPPVTTITAGPPPTTSETGATFEFSADQTGVTFACSLDGAAFALCSSPVSLTGLPVGDHEFRIQATNTFGLVELSPATHEWTIEAPADTTAPETTIDSGPPSETPLTTATFVFSANETDVSFACSLDAAAFTECSSPLELTGLSVGPHELRVAATDAAGNLDTTPASHAWTVEAPPPPNTEPGTDVEVTVPLPGSLLTATVTFATVTSTGLTTVALLESGPALPAGYEEALLYDIDTTAGFTAPVEVCIEYDPAEIADPSVLRLLHLEGTTWVDETTTNDPVAGEICGEVSSLSPFALAGADASVVPDTTIESGPPPAGVGSSADFFFSSNDPLATFECSLDADTGWGSCPVTASFEGLAAGDHELRVRAKNAAGLVDATPAVYSWTIMPVPDTTILSSPPEATENTTAVFTFASDQPAATFECLLDDATVYLPCTSPQTYADLAPGEHDFAVRAVDPAGNADPTPADWSWEIGDVPGTVVIESGPDATTESHSASFVFSTDDPTDAYECALDGGAYAPCTSPKAYGGVPVGAHRFDVRVLSPSAIVEPPVTSYTWTVVDTTPPDTTIDAGPAALIALGAPASLEFSASEPGSTFECRLDAAAFAACSSPVEYSDLPAGAYSFAVRAIDPSGNADGTPAELAWEVVAPPETTIDSGPEPDTSSTSASFTFSSSDPDASFECALDGGAFADCTSPHAVSGLADGEHLLQVRAKNTLGIADETPAEWTWTVELPPETTIASGPPPTTTSTTATFTFSASEPEVTFECALDAAAYTECFTPHQLSGLSVGEHTLRVRATDAAGTTDATPAAHTWTIEALPDTTPPETTIDSGPASQTGSTTASFAFSSNEPSPTFRCALDGETPATCVSPLELSGLSVGSHELRVQAVDAAGNADPTPATHTWQVMPPPETTIDSGPPSPSSSSAAEFVFSADQIGSTFSCSLDGGPFESCTSPHTVTGLGDGPHELRVRALSAYGALDPTPAAYAWTVELDSTPPETTIVAGPPATTPSLAATFAFASSEPGSTFACSLDGEAFAACDSPQSYAGLAPGEHAFEVRATDADGNTDPTAARHTWLIDVPAVTTIESGPPTVTESTNASFTFSANEAGVTFQCSVDGAPFATCSSPVGLSGLSLGGHSFEVRATDTAGNIGEPDAHAWTIVDETAPDTSITSGPDAITTNRTATFTFTSEAGATFECALDASGFSSCSSPLVLVDLAPGPHELRVRAKDASGNLDESPASQTWSVLDLETTITAAPPATTMNTSASFSFSSSEAGAGFECSLDGLPFTVCVSPYAVDGLADGAHEFRVRATMSPGLVDSSPATHAWTIDRAPDTEIESGPPAATTQTSATFTFSSDDAAASFECALDGPAFSSCTTPATFSGLAVGAHELRVRAKDAAGNIDATPAEYDWTVSPAPQTTIDSGPDAVTESTSATFVFSSDLASATFECARNGGPFAPCTSPAAYTSLALGSHEFAVRAVHPDGTADPTPAEYDWEIGDTTPPVTTITDAPASPATSTSASFSFSTDDPDAVLECSLDGAAFTVCTSPASYTGLAYGDHTFSVQATKHHLLVDPVPAVHEWTIVDVEPPDTAIDSGPPATTSDTSASFTFSSGDAGASFECSLDGAAFAGCTSPAEYDGLAVGGHTFRVRAVDTAGNEDETPAERSWTVEPPPDTTPPDTTLVEGPPSPTNSDTAIFQFTGSDAETPAPALDFECSLDGGTFTTCTSAHTQTGVAEGSRTFRVRAVDLAGNADPTPASHTWVVDRTPPETTIDSGPAASSPATSASFTFSASEAGTSFACSVDGGAFAACTSPLGLTGVAVGSHTFAVRATDAAGNADATPASFTWVVQPPPDTTPPDTAIGSAPPATTSATGATFAFTSTETGSTFRCKLDSAAFAACTTPATYSSLATGAHRFEVAAVDAAGNVDPTPAVHQWTITPPPNCGSPVTQTAVADAWLDENSATTNKGTDSILKVASKSPKDDFRALVRFNLPAIPAGCELKTAKLLLFAASATNGRQIIVQHVTAAWTENAVTWANQPAVATGTPAKAPSGLGNREWTITDQVKALYAPAANHGLLVRDETENGGGFEQQYHAREKGETPPRLQLTFGPVGG